ncbi:hypothetical protein PROFUN_02288 [Planoprotostelium fungivorum]|uniref:Uncharacterized protein n=1 Tax=Planoprotostelium fungivorum TaxID=1890364 RepID=A0A2P6NYI1_9EUKA|nr:hypothetical protein PROFUN_02288 [Planoprotostelium fungivorum]
MEEPTIMGETSPILGSSVSSENLLMHETFQYSPEEFQAELKHWIAEQWPVQFLIRDHNSAKIFRDNGVFSLMEFYNHQWKWDDDTGLSILYRAEGETESRYVPWCAFSLVSIDPQSNRESIMHDVQIQKTPQGWLLFDGWNYIQEGLIPVHLWQWKELVPSYRFPADMRPDHCYIDIVAYCWEHEGMQGFGFGTPHGHLAIEFGDELGNFYSVGMYMDPRSRINTKMAPAATVRAVLMSPDPYMPSHGEKTLHRVVSVNLSVFASIKPLWLNGTALGYEPRDSGFDPQRYLLGRGEEGMKNAQRLKKHIEEIQDWQRDEVTGRVFTCGRKRYHTFDSNCGVFCNEIEEFTIKELGGKLMALDDSTAVVPMRTLVGDTKQDQSWLSETYTNLYNRGLLMFVDAAIYLAVSLPWISNKIGVGKVDDGQEEPVETTEKDPNSQVQVNSNTIVTAQRTFDTLKNFAGKVKKPPRVLFPRRIRVDQLYSPRLKGYSARFKTSTTERSFSSEDLDQPPQQ